jgi:hypothetical protein
MRTWTFSITSLAAIAISTISLAPGSVSAQAHDTAFAALQSRGQMVMGVDQYTSVHRFDDLPDGGRIELQRDRPDSAGVATIRMHLAHIAREFAKGNFADPGTVHAQEVPGTRTMAAKHDAITYKFLSLPLGGEVRITTSDAEARKAIHAFLALQRQEHRAAGTNHTH